MSIPEPIRDAYRRLVKRQGSRTVQIGRLAQEAGIDVAQLHQILLREAATGAVHLSGSSMAEGRMNETDRGGAIHHPSRRKLFLVTFAQDSGRSAEFDYDYQPRGITMSRMTPARKAYLKPILEQLLAADEVANVGSESEHAAAFDFLRKRLSRDDYEEFCRRIGGDDWDEEDYEDVETDEDPEFEDYTQDNPDWPGSPEPGGGRYAGDRSLALDSKARKRLALDQKRQGEGDYAQRFPEMARVKIIG